jgi:histidinol dehydrogenase
MPKRLDYFDSDFRAHFAAIVEGRRETDPRVGDVVRTILADVRRRGDTALFELTEKFDHIDAHKNGLRISLERMAKAKAECSPQVLAALQLAADRISAFHALQMPQNFRTTDALGTIQGYRWTPIDAVGIYVPGGLAAYPSSVLMNALPARLAGVPKIIMVTPTPNGVINPLVLAAADLAGVTDIYTIGGAQAIAALAYGTATIPKVDKITGPGNAYVAEAKRQVFGLVGIDMVAGPSEILVMADGANNPAHIAADLLSQAEHDPAAQSILITDDPKFADATMAAVEAALQELPAARASWDTHGLVITVPNFDVALPLVDALAAEHIEIALDDPDSWLTRIRHAGSVFLGRQTPEAIGDYIGGPNHVLPTGRRARFSSGLSVTDFMKRTTFLGCSEASLQAIGPAAIALANAEGLPAHALSVSLRLNA